MKILNWFKSKIEYLYSVEYKCKKYDIQNYTINEDGTVDVNGNVFLFRKGLSKLPLKFRKVTGNFICSYNQLTSLEGSPKYVGHYFNCDHNELKTLEGSPKWVGGNFDCSFNNLTSLDGSPEYVGGNFICDYIDNVYVTKLNLYSYLLDHKSFIKQHKREQKLKELL